MEPDKSSDAVAEREGTDGLAFPVVGIGASAGGFAALATLLQNLPPVPDMALVVILHLPPDQHSSADRVLQSATTLPVVQVDHTLPILPNHVYVIPPDRSLTMRSGRLMLGDLARTSGDRTAIDVFFRTLAMSHKQDAVGVVLSGMGADGTAGLACIREQGGTTIAQLPADAEEGAMPQAAIDAGMADFVLPAAQIPARLMALGRTAQALRHRAHGRHAGREPDAAPFDMGPAPERTLDEVLTLLLARTGHDFRQYKRATLLRRLERRLQARGLADLQAYCRLLGSDPGEAHALLKDLLIGVTRFFRDPDAFAALECAVVPDLFRARAPADEIRVWSAACSTGEEAYSLAMLLAERADALERPHHFQVFASDIDAQALVVARTGLYPASIVADVPAERLQRHFTAESGGYRVRKTLRDRVLFAEHNLLHDPPFSHLGLIACRNFLIYLNGEVHRDVLATFNFALDPGGYLMLGTAETTEDAAHLFTPVDAPQHIYRAKASAHAGRRAPPLAVPGGPHAAPAVPASAAPVELRGRLFSFAEIHLQKAAAFAPPSILVNADSEIVHIGENASRFLRLAGGEPTRDIVALVAPELRLELRTALFRAHKSGERTGTGPVRYRGADGMRDVDMAVLPFHDAHAEGLLMLVTFDDVQVPAPSSPAAVPDAPLADRLDEELRQTRDKLRETIDQSDRAGAQMRTAHEELQSMVEELRAANQTLEARLAAQQSADADCRAVLGELQGRLDEATRRNDDLSNLIASSDVATLFLDRAMRIQRYTPRVASLFNVIPADIGRPLAHITNRLGRPQLADEAARVFETLCPLEQEVRADDGRSYIVRVHPYRTSTDRIEGAVMTFFDNTDRRAAEDALRASEARLGALFETLPVGVGVTDAEGKVLLSNVEMRRFLPGGVLPSRDRARCWRWHLYGTEGADAGPDDFPGARALRGERVVPGVEMRYRTEDDRTGIWTQVAAVPIRAPDGGIVGQVSVVTDIDRQKRADDALRDSEARLQLALDAARMGTFDWNMEHDTGAADARTMDLFGFEPGSAMSLVRMMAERIHPDDAARYADGLRRALARQDEGLLNEEVRVLLPGGALRWLFIRGQVFFADAPPRPARMIGTALDITLRKRAEAALHDSEARLQDALDGSNLLHAISTELIGEHDVAAFYDRIASAAMQLMHAPIAALQMLDEDASGTTLLLLASHGLPPAFTGFWQRMHIDPATVWDATLAGGRRVVVPDTAQCTPLADTPELETYRTAGIRAMQMTPLRARSGRLLGMISTYWLAPHVPSELSLRLLDILARQAADLVERTGLDGATGRPGA